MLRTLWRNLHMFLDILELGIENKKKIFKKNAVSEIRKNDLFIPYNPSKIRNTFMFVIFIFYFFIVFSLFSKSNFVDPTAFYCQIWDQIFKTVFLKKIFVLLKKKVKKKSKMSRNMCKWRHKVRNGPILPPWSPNFWEFFISIFTDSVSHFFRKSETT